MKDGKRFLWRNLVLLGGICMAWGCATQQFPSIDVSPAEIPSLERSIAQRPDDAATLARLGVAYEQAGRLEEATATLERAVQLPDALPATWAYLGVVAERKGDYAAAETAYLQYGELGGAPAREAVAPRLVSVQRQLLVLEARQALEREAELALTPPDPGTVAIMTLVVDGPEEYQPLGRGLAELLSTDLALTQRFTVVERTRLSALLEEMRLGVAGYTDPASAARTGRILRAERVVQGRLTVPDPEEELTLNAVIVSSQQPDAVMETMQSGQAEDLLALQVNLTLDLYRQLGVELTATEIARLRQRPTLNLQAFLAYSRGLVELDRANYTEAAASFQEAAAMDPDFQAAVDAAETAQTYSRSGTQEMGGMQRLAAAEVTGQPLPPPSQVEDVVAASTVLDGLVHSVMPAGTGAATTASPEDRQQQSTTPTTATTGTTRERETTTGQTVPPTVAELRIILTRPVPNHYRQD